MSLVRCKLLSVKFCQRFHHFAKQKFLSFVLHHEVSVRLVHVCRATSRFIAETIRFKRSIEKNLLSCLSDDAGRTLQGGS